MGSAALVAALVFARREHPNVRQVQAEKVFPSSLFLRFSFPLPLVLGCVLLLCLSLCLCIIVMFVIIHVFTTRSGVLLLSLSTS